METCFSFPYIFFNVDFFFAYVFDMKLKYAFVKVKFDSIFVNVAWLPSDPVLIVCQGFRFSLWIFFIETRWIQEGSSEVLQEGKGA